MNPGLQNKGHSVSNFEKMLPPQQSFEMFIDILNNDFIGKETKNSVLTVMLKIIQLDVIPRFRIAPAMKNPYF